MAYFDRIKHALQRPRDFVRRIWGRIQKTTSPKEKEAVANDPTFVYTPLHDPKNEIRLITLLPGLIGDSIKVVLWHTKLVQPAIEADNGRATMEEVRAALSPDWIAVENSEGRFLFVNETIEKTSWSHPNPDFDQSKIKQRAQLPPPGFSPNFEALSYVWGAPDNPASIEVAYSASGAPSANDDLTLLDWKTMSVGRNLFDGLNHVRLPDQSRVLWVDAICINQTDAVEKPDQIMRMADIYNLAFRVLSWLGPEAAGDNSGLALSTSTYIGQQIEAIGNGGIFETPDAKESKWYSPHAVFPYDATAWAAVQALLSRSYFERVWILQEVAGANDKAMAICGGNSISWTLLKNALIILPNNNTIPPAVRELAEALLHLAIRPEIVPIPDLFAMSRMRKCTDPRDKVYGVLGMAPRKFNLAMRPHYSKSLDFIYANAVMTYATMEHSLVLVQLCQISQRSDVAQKLPSWIPDFSIPEQTIALGSYMHVSGHSRAHFEFSDDCKTLTFTGKRVAVVKSVHGAFTPSSDTQTAIDTVRTWMPPYILTADYVTGGSFLDAFLLMLRCSYIDDVWPNLHEITLAKWREYFVKYIHGNAEMDESHVGQFYTTAAFIKNRLYVTTEEGHIGLAPLGTEPGMYFG